MSEKREIQIYNTLTRKKEPFEPLNPPDVLFYSCGPTVYDYFHIGNARNFVVFDTIRRYLEYRGFRVKFVQNITDIDDKIIRRALEEKTSPEAIAHKYTDAFLDGVRRLGIREATVHPKATECIPEMTDFVKRLIAGGYAYEVDGDVYFEISKFRGYGKLSGKRLEDLLDGARVKVDKRKRSPADFALWKTSKAGEPAWPSPWGKGRPGWHLECSVMAMKHLGETIDIHTGGIDLVFPHHENEIAQSESATSKPFARYWIHNGMLNIESEKMSKSLGNFLTIDQVLEKYDPMTVRYFLLSAHYRHPLNYTLENLREAQSAVARLKTVLETSQKLLDLETPPSDQHQEIEAPEQTQVDLEQYRDKFETVMDDDFNTARGFGVLFDLVAEIHNTRETLANPPSTEGGKTDATRDHNLIRLDALMDLLDELLHVLGFDLGTRVGASQVEKNLVSPLRGLQMEIRQIARETLGLEQDAEETAISPTEEDLDQILKDLIELRKWARNKKAYDLADKIRTDLSRLGIALEDHPQGTIWRRMSDK